MNSTTTSNVVEETFKRLNDVDDNDIEALNKIALDYAIIANSYIEIAKRILYLNRNYEFYQKAKEEYANAEIKYSDVDKPTVVIKEGDFIHNGKITVQLPIDDKNDDFDVEWSKR